MQDINDELAQYLNLSEMKGVLVKKVADKSPAQSVGIQNGDIILSIDNKTILSEKDYQATIRGFTAGEALNIKIKRNEKTLAVSMLSKVFPIELAMDLSYSLLGIFVEDLSPKNKKTYNLHAQEGVVISELNNHAYLARIGARTGDVIHQVDDIIIKNVNDFEKAIIKYRQKPSIVILLQRGDQLYNITVKF